MGFVLAGAVAVLAFPTTAGAGGVAVFDWNGRLNRPAVFAPGQRAEGETSVWFGAKGELGRRQDGPVEWGGPQDGPYFSYLRRVDDGDSPELEVRSTDIELGPVELTPPLKGSEHGSARLSFTVPEVEPGTYSVFTCNVGCRQRPGDLFASTILIALEPGEARNLGRILNLKNRLAGWANGLNHTVRKNDARLEHRTTALSSRLDSLSQELDELRSSRRRATRSSSGVPSAAWLGMGVLFTAATLRALRRR